MRSCWSIRWRLDRELDGEPRRERVARHLEGCAGCAARATQLAALHHRLREGAACAPPPRPRSWRLGWRAAGLAAAAALGLALAASLRQGSPPPAPDLLAAPRSHGPVARPSAVVSPVIDPPPDATPGPAWRSDVRARSTVLLEANPLRDELAALRSDGARGARALLARTGLAALTRR